MPRGDLWDLFNANQETDVMLSSLPRFGGGSRSMFVRNRISFLNDGLGLPLRPIRAMTSLNSESPTKWSFQMVSRIINFWRDMSWRERALI